MVVRETYLLQYGKCSESTLTEGCTRMPPETVELVN